MSHTDFGSFTANSKIIKVGENDRDRCLERNTHVYSLLSITLVVFPFPLIIFSFCYYVGCQGLQHALFSVVAPLSANLS